MMALLICFAPAVPAAAAAAAGGCGAGALPGGAHRWQRHLLGMEQRRWEGWWR